jgi:two-component system sensor histidine kinase/response regulator
LKGKRGHMNHQVKRILVVDDNQENSDLLQTFLSRKGYEALSARDGIEALEKLRAGACDLIISDVLMPRMDGFELCRIVKTDEKLKNIPVVFYTGHYTEEKDEELFQSLGAALYLVKPMRKDLLLKSIQQVLERSEEIITAPERFPDEEDFAATHADRISIRLTKNIEELERERGNLMAIFNASQVGMLLIDENGAVTRVNKVVTQLVGKEAVDMLSRQPGDGLCCIHAASVAEGCGHAKACSECLIRNTFTKVLRTGETIRGVESPTKLIINGEERKFYFSINASPMVLDERSHILLSILDITTLKVQEELLRESESRTRAITDSAQDAILMMDPEGRVSYWNPAAERILGYKSSEALGKKLHTFIVPPRYQEAHNAAFPQFQRDGRGSAVGKTIDLSAIRKDGMEIDVQVSLSAIHMNGGWHAVGVIRDITDRKRVEEELLKTNRRLQEATARANEMATQAEMANMAKSEFLANMSHEIRTPMNGVIGMTGLLLDTGLDNDQRRYAEIVRNSGESLLTILNDILDFSKIEAHKLELETLDFDLRALLDDFAAMLALRAEEKGLEFICAAAPDVPSLLRGDPGRLRQVLNNLTGNAVKFTHKGEIAVRASLVTENDCETLIRFSIKDTGIGIPIEKQQFLFQKFTQADASTTRRYGGTGLGLAISKQLAEMMGGEIGIASKEGQGAEFWFTSRFAKQAEQKHPLAPTAEICGVRVLVVDDNATNREVLMAQFKAWGVRSEETTNGPMALQTLYLAKDAADPFQVAIIDMQMPGMDGATLARIIKTDEKLKDIHLVLSSSVGQRGDAKKMQEIGFAAYLSKPIRHSEILTCLSAVLAGTAVPQQERAIVTRHMIREMRRGVVRILLAEDNITNQQVALGILKKLGLRADAAANGAEAVKALETLPYDLVLMDVLMPEMDGLEATRQIRNPHSLVRNHQIPIIAMTAGAMQGDREKCLDAGMNDYISKPISPQALADTLDKWLPKEKEAEAGVGFKTAPTSATASTPAIAKPAPLIFDKAGMMERMMDDEELARAVAVGFLGDLPKQIEALKSYLQAAEGPGVERQAHTIKGASANVGGEALRAVAFEMEKAAKAGDLKFVATRLPELEDQFARLKECMNTFIDAK